MAKIEKVAELAGVSTATVSRALAGKSSVAAATRRRVEEAARELGYVVSASASSLASGRMRNVGVVLPFLGSWFYGSVLNGAHTTLEDAGYDITLYHLDSVPQGQTADEDNPRRKRLLEEFLLRGRVDALIAVSLELFDHELESLRSVGKPLVGLGGPLEGFPTLALDDPAVARLATEHLISLGHRRIAHIGGDLSLSVDFNLPARRLDGYEQALRHAGIEVDPGLIYPGDFTISGGYKAARQLLEDPTVHPTAIFAASDEMAIGTVLAARELGRRIPEDLSVIGIDGHELAQLLDLTTIEQFPVEQGRLAAQTLLGVLEDHQPTPPPENTPLRYEVVARASTAAPSETPLS
jgi:DNA-binding LacI/PurR family transcriptional regulator